MKNNEIKINGYTLLNEKSRIVIIGGIMFMVIAMENQGESGEVNNDRIYYGLQMLPVAEYSIVDQNDMLIELDTGELLVAKCNLLFILELDIKGIFENDIEFVDCIKISKEFLVDCNKKINGLFANDKMRA